MRAQSNIGSQNLATKAEGATAISLEWPDDCRVYLTLDLECDFGTAVSENYYEAAGEVGNLVSLLEEFEIPLTCFVQTELLEQRPSAVDKLRDASVPVQFHPHSHTHTPRSETSVSWEVKQSWTRFREFFGESPTGYRFPNGNVRDADYRVLADHGFRFDASVFPSWRPGHFDNTDAPTVPTYRPGADLFELPFTVYSDRIRIPTALSYCQVLRRPYSWLLSERPPSVVVLNVHMHDLVTPSTLRTLPWHYRMLYSTTPDGLALLERFCETFEKQGYGFETLDEAHEQLRASTV